jgi:hypothetical protein
MGRARSGRYAAVYQSFSSPVQSAFAAMTWASNGLSASVGSNFWLHSYDHQVEIRMNGVVSGGALTPGATNVIAVADLSVYKTGVLTSVTGANVTALAPATTSGNQIVYAIIYSSTGLTKITGASGTAKTTRGSTGAPPFIPVDAICLGYVIRAYGAAAVILSSEISLTLYDGREYAHAPGYDEIRPLLGSASWLTAPAAIHTGGARAKVYWRGYSFNDNMVKIGEMKNWSLGESVNAEDATTQNAHAMENDNGRITYSFSYEEFISDDLHGTFTHVNKVRGDRIFKLYPDRTVTSKYWALQGRANSDMSFPGDDKSSSSNTVTVTGRVEEYTA